MGDALPVDHHPARQRAVCIRRMGAFGHAQERVSRLHGTAGNRRSRMSGADRRRNRGTSRRAARRLYLPTERGQEGEDLLHHARRYRLHSGAAERQPLQQGRVLVEIQARRGGFQGAAAAERIGRAGRGRLRRYVGAAHLDGERREDLPRTRRLHGLSERPSAAYSERRPHDRERHAERADHRLPG